MVAIRHNMAIGVRCWSKRWSRGSCPPRWLGHVLAVRAGASAARRPDRDLPGEPVAEHDLRFQHVDFLRQHLLEATGSPTQVMLTMPAFREIARYACTLGLMTAEEHDRLRDVKGARCWPGRWGRWSAPTPPTRPRRACATRRSSRSSDAAHPARQGGQGAPRPARRGGGGAGRLVGGARGPSGGALPSDHPAPPDRWHGDDEPRGLRDPRQARDRGRGE